MGKYIQEQLYSSLSSASTLGKTFCPIIVSSLTNGDNSIKEQRDNVERTQIIEANNSNDGFLPTAIKELPSSQEESLEPQNDSTLHSESNQTIFSTLSKKKAIRKRKNKNQKNKEIEYCQKDDGRGGNCIASNISKTLTRIIKDSLQKEVYLKFQRLLEIYKIKSQKENTIILLLLLYVFTIEGLINRQGFLKIYQDFHNSLVDSDKNCQIKMKTEEFRKSFHLKNKQMYTKFISMNSRLFNTLWYNLNNQPALVISLEKLEDIISETYDRKQREIQKAIRKIKSIILNYDCLKSLFCYAQNNINEDFSEAIEYAFRRNLPKRCKSVQQKSVKILDRISRDYLCQSYNDAYMICYLITNLLKEKSEEIWAEFIANTLMKNEFNLTKEDKEEVENVLKYQIPALFQKAVDKSQTKIQEDDSVQISNLDKLVQIYRDLKEGLEF